MKVYALIVSIGLLLGLCSHNQQKVDANDRYVLNLENSQERSVYAPFLEAKNAHGYDISFENASYGIVSVFYQSTSEKKKKLIVEKDDSKYIYNIFNNSEYVNYPLQLGNGQYKVSLYINTNGTKYKKLKSETYNVELSEKNLVYLQSILEIHWTFEDKSIELAGVLVDQALEAKRKDLGIEEVKLSLDDINQVLYEFVIETIQYDYDKIKGLDFSYIPDNDETIKKEKGICYDYSALYAAMLRSQGIPSKMAKGYAENSDVYHAWNEVYLNEEDRWVIVDTTFDAYMNHKGFPFDYEKDASEYNKLKEF